MAHGSLCSSFSPVLAGCQDGVNSCRIADFGNTNDDDSFMEVSGVREGGREGGKEGGRER